MNNLSEPEASAFRTFPRIDARIEGVCKLHSLHRLLPDREKDVRRTHRLSSEAGKLACIVPSSEIDCVSEVVCLRFTLLSVIACSLHGCNRRCSSSFALCIPQLTTFSTWSWRRNYRAFPIHSSGQSSTNNGTALGQLEAKESEPPVRRRA